VDDSILLNIEDGVALVTMNRPDKLNAMHAPMMERFLDTVGRLAADSSVGCVVLTGAGRGFCGGGDLSGKAADIAAEALLHPSLRKRPQTITGRIDWLELMSQVAVLLHDMPKPTIAMVNGPAAGAGFSLAGACDIRIAGQSAMFTSAFAKAGVPGDFGGAYFWSKIVGTGRARELFILSEKIRADRALEMGMVSRVYPDDELRDQTLALARELAAGPRHAYGMMKRTLGMAEGGASLAELTRIEAAYQTMASYEARERRQLAEDAERLPLS